MRYGFEILKIAKETIEENDLFTTPRFLRHPRKSDNPFRPKSYSAHQSHYPAPSVLKIYCSVTVPRTDKAPNPDCLLLARPPAPRQWPYQEWLWSRCLRFG